MAGLRFHVSSLSFVDTLDDAADGTSLVELRSTPGESDELPHSVITG